jgi:SAM-dependent methyltransferase
MAPTRDSNYIAPRLGGFGPWLAWHVRLAIFKQLMEDFHPTSNWRVLDVGVTSDQTADSNFFERLYPHPASITAVGLEDASHLERDFPGLIFIKADGRHLPFPNKSFDLAFCSAVIEHVGSQSQQIQLLAELTRVAERVVVTTPNRYFPLEFHTLTPFLHWLPPRLFRCFLSLSGRSFFAREANLNLLSERDLDKMLDFLSKEFLKKPQYLWGMKSNLVYYISANHKTA